MSLLNCPTLLYPNGGEIINSQNIVIQWQIQNSTDYSSFVYEIYYTDQFDPYKEPDWKQIAVVPASTQQFVWLFGNNIRSSTVRVAIRARNSNGERSQWSISASDFSIKRQKLKSPTIIAPRNGESFDKIVDIIMDESGIIGTYSQRSSYQFFYSSVSANIPLTAIAQNVHIGTGVIQWNILNLPPANDYVIQAYLADDDGSASESVFININIAHFGFFIIDTQPPQASIVINNNDTFTRNQNVTVNIASYDAATAVHSMQIMDGSNQGIAEPPSDVANYKLSNGDAIKSVQLLLQDYGANRNNTQIQRLFENIVELDDGSGVADITIDTESNTAWAITSSPSNYLYKIQSFPSLVATLDNEPTAITIFGTFPYIGLINNGFGNLVMYDGQTITTIKAFTEADSTINALIVYQNRLFIGFENGIVYIFDGITFLKTNGVDNPIKSFVSDGSLLFLTERNSTDVYVYNGSEFIQMDA